MKMDRLSQYSEFWLKFQKVVRGLSAPCQCFPQSDLRLKPKDGCTGGNHVFVLKEPILLKGMECPSGSGLLDAIIEYEEHFDASSYDVPVRASVSVHYFHREPGIQWASKQLYSLRFDYHPQVGGGDGDPITHVQMDASPPNECPPAYAKVIRQDSDARLVPSFKIFSRSHIPTPRMPLPAVLCFLMSDHYRKEVRTVIKETRDILTKISVPSVYAKWHQKCGIQQRSDSVGWAWYDY